eukprot:gene7397-9092_t
MKTLVIIFICISLLSPSLADSSTNCETLNENECAANFPQCQYLSFLSCCGKKRYACVRDDGSGCGSKISCGKETSSGEIYEFWSSCTPKNGWEVYYPKNETCESLGCESKGLPCNWKESTPCSGTSCCPRYAICGDVVCPVGFSCVNVNGIGSCIEDVNGGGGTTYHGEIYTDASTVGPYKGNPLGSACIHTKCPPRHLCRDQDGKAICIPPSVCVANQPSTTTGSSGSSSSGSTGPYDVCKNVQCPYNYHCEKQNNVAVCVPNQPSTTGSSSSSSSGGNICDNLQCPWGYHCEVKNGKGTCVPNQPSTTTGGTSGGNVCDNLQCPWGYHCEVKNGKATCVANQPSTTGSTSGGDKGCENQKCPYGFHCEMKDNVAICVPDSGGNDKCKNLQCPKGYHCEEKWGKAVCVRDGDDKCKLVCPWGYHCEEKYGKQICVRDGDDKCKLQCPKGHHCEEKWGKEICVKDEYKCKKECPWGHHCEKGKWGEEKCVKNEDKDACKNLECPKGYHCESKHGVAKCIKGEKPDPSYLCKNVICPKGFHCDADDGLAKCRKDDHGDWDPCDKKKCPFNHHCDVYKGKAFCFANGDPNGVCKHKRCPPKHHCESLWGRPKCIQDHGHPHDECRKLVCPPNHHCESIGKDKVACVKDKDACYGVNCPQGFVCLPNQDGTASCVISSSNPTTGIPPITTGTTTSPSGCPTCATVQCEQQGLVCVYMKQNCSFPTPRLNCCSQLPVCIKANTIAGSTIASTSATTANTVGSTIASLVTTSGTSGGTGSTTTGITTRGITTAVATTGITTSFSTITSTGSSQCGPLVCSPTQACISNPPSCVELCSVVTCDVGNQCVVRNNIALCVPLAAADLPVENANIGQSSNSLVEGTLLPDEGDLPSDQIIDIGQKRRKYFIK